MVELENELKIDPRHPNASYEIVDISYKRGQLNDAEEFYLRSLKHDPGIVEAYLGVERIYSVRNDHKKALESLRKVVELAPENATPHYRMATIYRKPGDAVKAQEAMSTFQRLKREQDEP